jgi:hypothetical protein
MAEAPLSVAYLLWAPLGTTELARFVSSYQAQPAGIPHRLVIVCNGFSGADDDRLVAAQRALAGVEHDLLVLDAPVLDLAAYAIVAERLAPARCCFLNSYSTILAPDWLALLSDALDAPGVGLVGASGSWGSMRSYVRFQFGLGGAYGEVFSDRRKTNQILAAIDKRNRASGPAPGFLAGKVKTARSTYEQTHGFASFPARHIRSTGFMIDTDTLARLEVGRLTTKIATYRLESGSASLAAQVERLGLGAVVVDRHGHAFSSGEWPASRTFWQARQENLLIADKQTAHYQEADEAGRAVLAGFAWGAAADTSPAALDD